MGMWKSNFKQDILREAGGEEIEGIVIGRRGWKGEEDVVEKYVDAPDYSSVLSKILTWEEAAPYLDYEYNDNPGTGLPECNAIVAWTASKVIFVSFCEWDVTTDVQSVPRHPVAHEPELLGK